MMLCGKDAFPAQLFSLPMLNPEKLVSASAGSLYWWHSDVRLIRVLVSLRLEYSLIVYFSGQITECGVYMVYDIYGTII